MPKKQKLSERRPPQGGDYVLLVDSPHWKPGVVLHVERMIEWLTKQKHQK